MDEASLKQLETQQLNTSPVIGVLCIDVAQILTEIYGKNVHSYIAASYIKYLEGAGARVVPIWIGRRYEYYEDIMSKINGILIPGGAVFINYDSAHRSKLTNDCVVSSQYVYEIATQKNATGEFFPLWGTCLGFQLLVQHSASHAIKMDNQSSETRKLFSSIVVRDDCERMDCALPIDFKSDFRESTMFKSLPTELERIMLIAPFAYHYHRFCVTEETLKRLHIDHEWHVLGTNKDRNGLCFISIAEHRNLPYFGCQFHPERVAYEYLGNADSCAHDRDSVEVIQYLANFFVEICRKSANHFPTSQEEQQHMIWNFSPVFTGMHDVHWLQCYLFSRNTDYPSFTGGESIDDLV